MPVPAKVLDNQPELRIPSGEPYKLVKVWYRVVETEDELSILYVYEWDNSWPWWDISGLTQHSFDYEPVIYCRNKHTGVVTWTYDAGHYDADHTSATSVFDVTQGSHQYGPNTSGATGTKQPASMFEELPWQKLLEFERNLIKVATYGTGQLSLLEAWFKPCHVKETDAFTTPWEGTNLDTTSKYKFETTLNYMDTGTNYWYNFQEITNLSDRPITSLKICFEQAPDIDSIEFRRPRVRHWKWRVDGKCLILELEEGYAASEGVKKGDSLEFIITSNSWSDLGVGDLTVDRGNSHTYEDDEPNIRVLGPVAAVTPRPEQDPVTALAFATTRPSFGELLGPSSARVFAGITHRRRPFDLAALLDDNVEADIGGLYRMPVTRLRGIGKGRAEALREVFGVRTVGDLARIGSHPLVRLGSIARRARDLHARGEFERG